MGYTEGGTWAASGFERNPLPSVYVQWKGTEVCLDFHCVCGYSGHFDGGFAYGLRCGGCERLYTMPHTFGLIEGADPDGLATQDTDWPHIPNPELPEPLEVVTVADPFAEAETDA